MLEKLLLPSKFYHFSKLKYIREKKYFTISIVPNRMVCEENISLLSGSKICRTDKDYWKGLELKKLHGGFCFQDSENK